MMTRVWEGKSNWPNWLTVTHTLHLRTLRVRRRILEGRNKIFLLTSIAISSIQFSLHKFPSEFLALIESKRKIQLSGKISIFFELFSYFAISCCAIKHQGCRQIKENGYRVGMKLSVGYFMDIVIIFYPHYLLLLIPLTNASAAFY